MESNNNTQISNKAYKRANIIVIVLSVILVGMIVTYFMQRREYSGIISEIQQDKETVQKELESMLMGYDSLETENEFITSQMELSITKVKLLAEEVATMKKASYQQINKYKSETETMRGIMQNFVVQLDSIHKLNQRLTAENEEYQKENNEVRNVNRELVEQKKDLEKKVSLAAALSASSLRATAISKRGKETTLVRKATQIKVSFVLPENQSATRGKKYIYMRVMKPDQTIFTTSDKDHFRFENKRIEYSASREIIYEAKELPVNIFWDNKKVRFAPGKYVVDIFVDGKNIGTTELSLK